MSVWSIPAVLLLLLLTRQWPTFVAVLGRLRREPLLLAALPLAAVLIGLHWGLFLWASDLRPSRRKNGVRLPLRRRPTAPLTRTS